MTAISKQKHRELHYLDKAREVYCDLPTENPVLSESPDFLFPRETNVLGVEMTSFIRGLNTSSVSLRTLESLHRMVAQQAKAKFESKHGISLWIGLHWDNRFRFTKRDVDTIATQLVSLIELDIPGAPYGGAVFDWDSHGDLPIFDAIDRVSVRRLRDGAKGVWAEIEGGFVGGTVADIQTIVDLKESRIDSYLSRCDECWLLVVADGTHISSSLELEIEPSDTIQTKFERVLVYQADSNTVSRLK